MTKFVIASLAMLISVSAIGTELECKKAKQRDGECFLDKSQTIKVNINGRKISVESSEMGKIDGDFEKVAKKTGDSMYSAPDLANLMDQSDLGKVFVSKDEKKVTLTIRFTDDDGPQSFYTCDYRCK